MTERNFCNQVTDVRDWMLFEDGGVPILDLKEVAEEQYR